MKMNPIKEEAPLTIDTGMKISKRDPKREVYYEELLKNGLDPSFN